MLIDLQVIYWSSGSITNEQSLLSSFSNEIGSYQDGFGLDRVRDHFGKSRSLEFMTNIMPSCEFHLFNLVLYVPLRFVGTWYKKLTNSSSSSDDGITCKYGLKGLLFSLPPLLQKIVNLMNISI